jgi:hypothetical protein
LGIYVEGLESIIHGNIGDEEVPRPFDHIHTLIDVVDILLLGQVHI